MLSHTVYTKLKKFHIKRWLIVRSTPFVYIFKSLYNI